MPQSGPGAEHGSGGGCFARRRPWGAHLRWGGGPVQGGELVRQPCAGSRPATAAACCLWWPLAAGALEAQPAELPEQPGGVRAQREAPHRRSREQLVRQGREEEEVQRPEERQAQPVELLERPEGARPRREAARHLRKQLVRQEREEEVQRPQEQQAPGLLPERPEEQPQQPPEWCLGQRPEPQPEPPPEAGLEHDESPERRLPEQERTTPPPPPPVPVAPRPPRGATAPATRAPVGLLYHTDMALHRCLNDMEHIENPKRIVRIFERLEQEGLAERCVRVPCRKASREELGLKHTPEHVERIMKVQGLTPQQSLEEARKYNSIFLCPQSTKAGLLSAGSVIEATARVCSGELQSALCVVRPPGHHAERTHAMGFCLFGNVAVAVAEARRKGWSARTLVVDWDLHHGNGTQRMFEEDDSVLYFSLHRHDEGNFYPRGNYGHYLSHGKGAGAGYSVNVPWDVKGGQREGVPSPGDAEFLETFRQLLLPLAAAFQPDLVLVSAGFDAAEGDPIGECRVTPAGYFEMTRSLMSLVGGRLVLALEGGYGLEGISASVAACARALLGPSSDP